MADKLMILPGRRSQSIRLVSLPDDLESQEAFRHVTGVISSVEEAKPDYTWEDLEDALEAHGYRSVDFVLGPAVD